MEALEAIDAVDSVVHAVQRNYRQRHVRVQRPVMDAALHRLRQSTQPWLANLGSTKTPDLLDALDATVLSAREIPILGGARIDARRVYDILDQLRQSVVQDILAHRKNAEAV